MTAREISPHHRPVFDNTLNRPRPPMSRFNTGAGQQVLDPSGDTCVVAFYYKRELVYEETVPLIANTAARAVLTAVQDALNGWRRKAGHSATELRKMGYSTDFERWDEAAVNGKRFPRPANL